MQFLCQRLLAASFISSTVKSRILHRDWRKLTQDAHYAHQTQKNRMLYFGAILHQNGSLLFSHQFRA
jgi:hypothetical protein